MSQSDSFIDEVTEAVRRDRLFAWFRRYGWIALLGVLILVGGAAVNEWRKAQARAAAEAVGDTMLAALQQADPAKAAEDLAKLPASDSAGQRAVTDLLTAAADVKAGKPAAAIATLDTLAADAEVPQAFRDIAALKAVMLGAKTLGPDERIARLEKLAVPGAPFRLLAEEQIALAQIEKGEKDKALETLQKIIADAEVTQDLRSRAAQLIVALGGTPKAA